MSLKHLFGPADLTLHTNTNFQPRYFYYAGAQMDMDDCETNYPECGDLCVAKGKYCQHDPDGDITGYTHKTNNNKQQQHIQRT